MMNFCIQLLHCDPNGQIILHYYGILYIGRNSETFGKMESIFLFINNTSYNVMDVINIVKYTKNIVHFLMDMYLCFTTK